MDAKPSPYVTGLLGRCPNCGEGPLYQGLLKVAPACPKCGFDNSVIDTGDGPMVFGSLFVGAIVTLGALVVELAFAPPYWVHALIWAPLIVILPLVFLRVFKSLLFSLQIHHEAEEMRIDHEQ